MIGKNPIRFHATKMMRKPQSFGLVRDKIPRKRDINVDLSSYEILLTLTTDLVRDKIPRKQDSNVDYRLYEMDIPRKQAINVELTSYEINIPRKRAINVDRGQQR